MLECSVFAKRKPTSLSIRSIWVARTLVKNGRVFLVDTFLGNEALADSVNHLLAVGFYLINIGYVALALKYGEKPVDLTQAIESLSSRVGLVLLVLGGMHFFNLYVFTRLRRRALLRNQKPPVSPEQLVEQVHVWNVTRGTRLQTYAIAGEPHSGVVCINGAAAHLVSPGDLVIVATFTELDEAEARRHRPRVVLVDAKNRIVQPDAIEVPGPKRRA